MTVTAHGRLPMPEDLNPDDELSWEELEAQAADALPERAAMSTLNLTGLDATSGAVEAAGDGLPDAGHAAPAETAAQAPADTAAPAEPVAPAEPAAPAQPAPPGDAPAPAHRRVAADRPG